MAKFSDFSIQQSSSSLISENPNKTIIVDDENGNQNIITILDDDSDS